MIMSDPDDQDSRELVARTTLGDIGALDELFAKHLPGLTAWVRLRAGELVLDRESVDDVVQSACREVLENLDRFHWGGEAGFRHWLYETALRKIRRKEAHWLAARRDVRREEKIARRASGDASSLDIVATAYRTLGTPSVPLRAREFVDRIESAFRTLPDAQQEAVAMSRIAGMSYAEIAGLTGRSEATVRSDVHRGLAAIADVLVRRDAEDKPR